MKKYQLVILILSLIVIFEGFLLFKAYTRKQVKIIIRPKITTTPAFKGKIAIVLDDWGYNLNNLHILKEIKAPLTLSVLPNLPYTKSVCQEGYTLGFEIILHLPSEPKEKVRLEQNTILTTMKDKTITDIVDHDLENIDYVRGLSNHMGSKVTEDERVMNLILKELKQRKLYFLDSWVTSKSVGASLAKKMNLPFLKRDIFLDNNEDAVYIRSQINKLKNKARINGQAVGIGHDRKITLETLREIIPELENEGYKIVLASSLTKETK